MVIGFRYKFQIYSFKSAIFFLVSGKNKSEDDESYEVWTVKEALWVSCIFITFELIAEYFEKFLFFKNQ